MSGPFLSSTAQMRRIAPSFPLSHGVPREDNRRVVSGTVYVIRHGLQWKDAPHSVTGSITPAAIGLPSAASLAPRGEAGN